jgi:hypothetical protein
MAIDINSILFLPSVPGKSRMIGKYHHGVLVVSHRKNMIGSGYVREIAWNSGERVFSMSVSPVIQKAVDFLWT